MRGTSPRPSTSPSRSASRSPPLSSGYYQSIWISVTHYRVYHHTATLKDAVAITPDKAGECVKLQIQKYADNAWRAYTMTGCGTVSKSGKVTVSSKLGPTGRFRVQADFRASAKDTANVSTNGGWLYYEVTK